MIIVHIHMSRTKTVFLSNFQMLIILIVNINELICHLREREREKEITVYINHLYE